MSAVRFDGQVAIVTGAAGGIGRAVAHALAQRGAIIAAVDYGGNTSGQAGGIGPAQQVADEIAALGTRSLAISTPIGTAEGARSIVAQVIDEFGRVDMLVNIAGSSLPGAVDEPSDDEVEQHFALNLVGVYHLVRAVWPHMREQQYGRILNTSSNAAFGIGANAPYGSTRAGIIGMTFDNAIEGQKDNILVNAMMPAAFSRLIAGIPNPDFVQWFKDNLPPAKVAEGIVYFLSSRSQTTGRVFSVGGGHIARVGLGEGHGFFDPDINPETVAENLVQIDDMTDARFFEQGGEELDAIAGHLPAPKTSLKLDQETVSGSN